jgi:hypothetical protein
VQAADVLDEEAKVLEVAQGSLDALDGERSLALVVEANKRRHHGASGELCSGMSDNNDA